MPKLSETLDKMSVAAEKLAEQAEAGMDGGEVVLDALDWMNRTLDSIDSHLEKLVRVLG